MYELALNLSTLEESTVLLLETKFEMVFKAHFLQLELFKY